MDDVGIARRSLRRLTVVMAAALLAAAAVVGGIGSGSPVVIAFDHNWTLNGCTGVSETSTQYRFLDDAPAGSVDDEGVFITVNANDTSTESCTWWTATNLNLQATVLTARAAVNDGAILTISAHQGQTCSAPTASVVWSGATANNGFRVLFDEEWDAVVQRICIKLADSQAANAQRLSAIIDDIYLVDGTLFVFQEGFGRDG